MKQEEIEDLKDKIERLKDEQEEAIKEIKFHLSEDTEIMNLVTLLKKAFQNIKQKYENEDRKSVV